MSTWSEKIIGRLRLQKNRTDQQELLVLLFDKITKTKVEEVELAVLLKVERTRERAKAAEVSASKILSTRKDEERKARNHRLIHQGLLIDLAKLNDRSKGEILGGLLALAQSSSEKWVNWKQHGDELIAQREREKPST